MMAIPRAVFQEKHVLPSILSADFAHLGEDVATVLDAGARLIHVDVMDGHFVPNITIGPPVVASISSLVHERGGVLDVHLMIENPERYAADFANAGADALSVHIEGCVHVHRTLAQIRELGLSAGVVINPGTDVAVLGEALGFADYVLVMSVDPGFGGQHFIPQSLKKIARLRQMIPPEVAVEVDGGVNAQTIGGVVRAGANWLVAGSAVFSGGRAAAEMRRLHLLMDEAAVVIE